MKLVLISHFYNEEFLLPYWLKHHVPLFNHGVLIDYASTDRSRAIIRQLAPHWEVRPSCNQWFDAALVDREIMQIEEEFDGWKMVLNTTEFLVHDDLRAFLGDFTGKFPAALGVRTTGIVMVDRLTERDRPLTDEPLFLQKQYGYFESGLHPERRRLLHRARNGSYQVGRHTNSVSSLVARELFLAWFGWCPIAHIRERKLAIQQKIPLADKRAGRGWQHLLTAEQLEARYRQEERRSYDLAERNDTFRTVLQRLRLRLTRSDPAPLSGTLPTPARPPSTLSPCTQAAFAPDFHEDCDDLVETLLQRRMTADQVLQLGPETGDRGEAAQRLKIAVRARHYIGLFRSADAASRSAASYDRVLVADLGQDLLGQAGLQEGSGDLLLILGVLQCLPDPWTSLAHLAKLIRPHGHVVLYLPNAQNISNLTRLVEGTWRYQRPGPIDPDQLRFFARQDLAGLLGGAGLQLVEVVPTRRNPPFEWADIPERGNALTAGKMTLTDLTRDELGFILADHFIVIGRRCSRPHGLG